MHSFPSSQCRGETEVRALVPAWHAEFPRFHSWHLLSTQAKTLPVPVDNLGLNKIEGMAECPFHTFCFKGDAKRVIPRVIP